MSKLVIRKRVTLEFLGDDYKAAYIDFRSIPVGDYGSLLDTIKTSSDDDKKANAAILQILKEYYLKGEFPNEEGKMESLDSKEELDGLDKDALIECFGKLTGQDIKGALDTIAAGGPADQAVDVDPKSEAPSKPGSTADIPPQ
jgi:hypothetical protein